MSVTEQVLVLLALTNELFDTIPIEKMQEAELTLVQHKKEIADEILQRLLSAEKLSDEDREAILSIAKNVLAPFQMEPESDQTKK
jgi:F-type H+-transporting ATPase subunit alpha